MRESSGSWGSYLSGGSLVGSSDPEVNTVTHVTGRPWVHEGPTPRTLNPRKEERKGFRVSHQQMKEKEQENPQSHARLYLSYH